MKIIVTDRETIQRGLVVKSTFVVISITDPGVPRTKIKKASGLKDVLYLSFNDSEPVDGLKLPKEIRLMTEDHARAIWKFVNQHRQVGAIVVHCHQGMSRSPAIAAAISRYLGLDEAKFHRNYQPNQFIYDLMIETMPRKKS